jgi:hypothetical protein
VLLEEGWCDKRTRVVGALAARGQLSCHWYESANAPILFCAGRSGRLWSLVWLEVLRNPASYLSFDVEGNLDAVVLPKPSRLIIVG